ncbi:MAG: sensor histidine kinase inhibitor, KipI family [Marmoricola sp.]|nr:sensor histidine kinase inhibitor, KipI family [Marmoricola sp.]
MEARSVGDQALLLECAGPDEVRAAYAEARRRQQSGELSCTDIIPAAATLLLDGLRDLESVRSGLGDWPVELPDDVEDRLVELAVTYDGPDLESVARHCGMDVDEVVERHRGTELLVAFCGFAPGFAYLSGLPKELHVPRLEKPRSKVPAGSVGLAGTFTGVYPRSSPGGWQLIARTDERLWDAERDPPALLTPGTRVRFVDSDG